MVRGGNAYNISFMVRVKSEILFFYFSFIILFYVIILQSFRPAEPEHHRNMFLYVTIFHMYNIMYVKIETFFTDDVQSPSGESSVKI